jgi:hypothetical protein
MIELNGGPDRDRTDDLFHAMEARSQLRHRPTRGNRLSILSLLGSDSSNRPRRGKKRPLKALPLLHTRNQP